MSESHLFEPNKAAMHPESVTSNDIEGWEEKIFQAWYARQSEPITKVIREIMVKEPTSDRERLYNLFCLAYLYAQRTQIRKQRQAKDFLRKKYADENAGFALDDVDFQHQVVGFLDAIQNQELQDAFWSYFEERMRMAGNKPHEMRGAKKGILGLREAMRILRSDGFSIELPTPEEDAHEKIDLFGEKNGESYLFQIKTPSRGSSGNMQIVPASRWRELYAGEEIKKDQEEKYGAFLDAFETRKRTSHKPLHALVMTIPNPLREGRAEN